MEIIATNEKNICINCNNFVTFTKKLLKFLDKCADIVNIKQME